jgi:hypothetical protein
MAQSTRSSHCWASQQWHPAIDEHHVQDNASYRPRVGDQLEPPSDGRINSQLALLGEPAVAPGTRR